MFNLVEIRAWLKQKAVNLMQSMSYFLLGDLPEVLTRGAGLLNDRSYNSPEYESLETVNKAKNKANMGLMRIGPVGIGRHYALIRGSYDEKEFNKQLKFIMALPEKSARFPYETFNLITGASLLLANNTKEALTLHKDFSRFLKPDMIIRACIDKAPSLVKALMEQKTETEQKKTIENFVIHLLAEIMLGIELTPGLAEIMKNIEDLVPMEVFLLPQVVQKFLPSVKEARKNIDLACQEFIRKNKNEIAALLESKADNFLLMAIRSLCAESGKFSQLSDAELNKIADAHAVRTAIFSIFAAGNTAKVIAKILWGMSYGSPEMESLRKSLENQDDEKLLLQGLDREKLQALYSVGVAKFSGFTQIYRYTSEAIHNELLDIPANTSIICRLDQSQFPFDLSGRVLLGHNLFVREHDDPSSLSLEELTKEWPGEGQLSILFYSPSKNSFYFYGTADGENWKMTNLGCLQNSIPGLSEFSRKFTRAYSYWPRDDQYFPPQAFYKAINDRGLHKPFSEDQYFGGKLDEGYLAPFGVGVRKCPAANLVKLLSQYMMMYFIKHVECDKNEVLIFRTAPVSEDIMNKSKSISIKKEVRNIHLSASSYNLFALSSTSSSSDSSAGYSKDHVVGRRLG